MSATGPVPPAVGREFRRRLAAWFRRRGRDLPWRATRDPYRVLVSEAMLQQTQVSRVVQFYGPFLERYPDVHTLAAARPRAVREAWNGLGYYARARNLHALARQVVRERDGRIPDDPEALRTLPGIGAYTAGAVASFAYEQRAALVDTNVARVLRRAFAPRTNPRTGRGVRRLWAVAEALLPRTGPAAWTHNQALIELGALVCAPRVPRCGDCPVRTVCRSATVGPPVARRHPRSAGHAQ